MSKDEMKNRISMALKDPILQQGFEIICKENAILKGRTEEFEKQILGLLYKYESVYKRFPDLKDAMDEAERILKENAELKEHIKADCIDCADYIKNKRLEKENVELKLKLEALDGQIPWKDIKDKSEVIGQLTKAKDIIKKFLDNVEPYSIDNDVLVEAEQFLKDLEK